MLNYTDVENIFKGYEFPEVVNPISENGDTDKVSAYLQKLATDESFLSEQTKLLAGEVSDILLTISKS
jgi:hypothetical protein